MKHTLALLAALLLATSLTAQGNRPPRAFQPGDRWCVLGDSITRSGQYHRYIELFYLTRYPARKLDVINCGISGDTAPGALQRLQWDCLDAKPTVVSVMLGMNDRAHSAETYDKALRQLTKSLVAAGAKVILLTPSIFDDTADLPAANSPGGGAVLAAFAERVRAIADEFKVPVIDFNGPMTALNAEQQKRNPKFTIVGGDRIHPTPPGHLVMAYEFLRAQGLTGVVSRITIDAAAGKAGVLENCTVKDLKIRDGEVVFTCLENALPFPVEAKARPALDLVPFSREFNQQILLVRGLAPGHYALTIDGKEIRTFTAPELADGVNLASEANTPQSEQSLAVLAELQKKWDVVAKLRNLAVCEHTAWPNAPRPVDLTQMPAKLDARLARSRNNPVIKEAHQQYLATKPQEAELWREVEQTLAAARLAAQPKPHEITLRCMKLTQTTPTP
jgi:lysophospholipase L1-like esterase